MKRVIVTLSALMMILASLSVSADDNLGDRVAGQWKGSWSNAPITLNLTKGAADKDKVKVAGKLTIGAVRDPLAAPDGPKTVSPMTDVTGTVKANGAIDLMLQYPDLEGRSQPEPFTGMISTGKATTLDVLTLKSKDGKTTITLNRA